MDFGKPFGGLFSGAEGAVLRVLLRTGAPLTGRQVWRLVESQSLAVTQNALKSLTRLGVVNVSTVGRSNQYTINPDHYAVQPLRVLVDPIAVLVDVVKENVDDAVTAVLLFGSVARGEASAESDIDLVVIASSTWDERVDLQAAVTNRLGNDCDVLVFSESDFSESAEPVVKEIIRDGVALYGVKPQRTGG